MGLPQENASKTQLHLRKSYANRKSWDILGLRYWFLRAFHESDWNQARNLLRKVTNPIRGRNGPFSLPNAQKPYFFRGFLPLWGLYNSVIMPRLPFGFTNCSYECIGSNSMRFSLIDRILAYEPGVRLTAKKNVSLSEEYLADHFPQFPVLPGVFMLEAMTQSAAWLIRLDEDFAHSIVCLKEVRNAKYADFVTPGSSLEMTVDIIKEEGRLVKLKGRGTVNGRTCVTGRLTLERYNLAETYPEKAAIDRRVIAELRTLHTVLTGNTQA